MASKACWMIYLQPKLNFGWNLVVVVPVPFFNGLCSSRRFHVHEHCGFLDKRHDKQHVIYSANVMFTDTTAVAWSDQSFLPFVPRVEFLATHGSHPLPLKWFTVLASPDDFVPKLMGWDSTHGPAWHCAWGCVCVLEGQLTLFEIQVFVATVACLHVLCTICVWTLVCVWHTVIYLC